MSLKKSVFIYLIILSKVAFVFLFIRPAMAEYALGELGRRLFEVPISRDFRRGDHLIYDCVNKHFICVNSDGRELCQQRRQENLRDGHYLLSCAHIKSFDRYDDCVDKQYELIHRPVVEDFCYNLELERKRLRPF